MSELARRARLLRGLHAGPELLVLPNAWDVASARAFAGLGFPALATTSAGVAAALGFEDGERAPADEMLAAAARIARAVDVPVTADLEGGYGLGADELVARTLETGATGMNIEDTDHSRPGELRDASEQAARLAAIRAEADTAGVPLVLNARVDVYVRRLGEPDTRLEAAVERARLYLAAGADCVYPITLVDENEIAAFCAAVPGAVNILAMPGSPQLARLAELGVARVTFGSGLFRRALEAAERFAAGLPRPSQEPARHV